MHPSTSQLAPTSTSASKRGFEFDSNNLCVNVNECESVCIDTIGSFLCICSDGFVKNGQGLCEDINECNSYLNDCDINARCNNTLGSFTCTCNEFWQGTGTYCESKFCDPCGETQDCYYTSGSCPPNSYAIRTFTDTETSQCRCYEGYYWANSPITPKNCTLCPRGSYCSGEEIFACPDNSMNYYGQNVVESCVCNQGFYRSGSTCIPCPYGYFCPGDNLFYACPNNSTSLFQASSISECLCFGGYYYQCQGATAAQAHKARLFWNLLYFPEMR
ncbi:hypothetical protein GUITHDRAFT_138089 [Guillardia theta CCMP2712]|uniref:EGF-like domain-containing protein n=1 Tax=Guillardia theta (strain CCMP2712) TaxID=905079 RepID=L1JEK7_GUITC|nr:hypothetical protein GUITHDRAFT_138089 [Guillardia theta CCMP2712]EKX46737.1 hypothetical protein GUITHDRAFT_138089 [Guillardia theta CCMP2712]|eukprot:XP_005833717.1 hypothetical protein GUITHDRAFT_138089 [Guillardia theta CCMP2712]